MIRLPFPVGTAVLACLMLTGPSSAQDIPSPVQIDIHPAGPPKPALKYLIVPGRETLVAGNAAIFYHRAIELLISRRVADGPRDAQGKAAGPSDESLLYDWVNDPLTAFPLDRAKTYLQFNDRILRECELGALRRSCDWEFDSRPEGFELLIGEIQEIRSVLRIVALKARVAIREGRIDEALHWIQVGYAVSRHVGKGPILIQGLVGVANAQMFSKVVEDLIQTPGAPNLFWALTDRPRPFIDLRDNVEGERFFLEREFPRLRELDSQPWSVAEARAFADEFYVKLRRLTELKPLSLGAWGTKETRDWLAKMEFTALVAHAYPSAKSRLIAAGQSRELVESMPTFQVVMIDAYAAYQDFRDEIFKWRGVENHRAQSGLQREDTRPGLVRDRPLVWLLCSLLIGLPPALLAQGRCDRTLDVLTCIEAIRMHAARHERLPARLEDVDVPIPIDPLTGKPFAYRLEGDRAFLSAPDLPERPGYHVSYELKLVR